MRFYIALFIFIFSFASFNLCHALSDAEYDQLMQTSAKFREENSKLADQWDGMKKTIKGDAWKKVLQEQKAWVEHGRDDAAKKNMSEGYTREYAYAKATHDRVAELWAFEENFKLTPQEIAAGDAVEPAQYDEPTGSLYGAYDGKNMGEITKIIPTNGDLSQVQVQDAFGHTHIYYISRKDIAARKKEYQSKSELSECQDPEPREMNRPYLFEIMGETATPESARKLGDKNPTIKIISNFNQCYG